MYPTIMGGSLGKWDILDDTRFALPGVSRSQRGPYMMPNIGSGEHSPFDSSRSAIGPRDASTVVSGSGEPHGILRRVVYTSVAHGP